MLFARKKHTSSTVVTKTSSSSTSPGGSTSSSSFSSFFTSSFSNSPENMSDSSTISARGPGLTGGTAGNQCMLTIYAAPGGPKFNATSVSVAFEGPSKPEIKFTTNKDGSVDCSWLPKLPGTYKIHIRYDDKDINGSPFVSKITGGEELVKESVGKIKCSGTGLASGKTMLTNEIIVDTKDSGIIGGLTVSMEGPAKPEINFKNNNNGTLTLQYKPDKAGTYKLNLKFAEVHVPGSPFTIAVK